MQIPFNFHPNVVVRTPRFPFSTGVSDVEIDTLMNDTVFLESIYLASPVLYSECLKYSNGILKDPKEIQKLKRSVVKYYLRSVSRCTPFGLFSGCCVSEWSAANTGLVINSAASRHTRFDMHYLCALAQHLAKETGIKEQLLYFTNNSIYNIGDEIRYVEYKYLSGTRIHQISSVNAADYLEQILAKGIDGIALSEVEEMLAAPGISNDEITIFIDELLNAQLLVSELEPSITGDEFVHQVLSVLKRIFNETGNDGVLEIIEILETANNKLQRIDTAESNTAAAYKEIMQLLEKLGVSYDESKLFQTDMLGKAISGGIPGKVQDQLLKTLQVLNRFGAYNKNQSNLQSFAKRFYERYEEREMPLLEVLDTETGIGYLEAGGEEHVPLVEDIVFSHNPNPVQDFKWSPVEKYLIRKVTEAYQQGKSIVEIREEEMTYLVNDNWDDLPPSMHIMFRIIDPEKNMIYIENCGSSSAVNLLGRFAHADKNIAALANDIVAKEEELNMDVIFAEIIHLPESRVGNVLLHPAFRKYEIPYLAKSSLDKEHQINVQDLLVSVKRGNVQLRSKRNGKYIIPRLSNAHNFQSNALPVYQFLCDMQTQQLRGGLGFHWGSITYHFKSLPRVQFQNTIISPATWRLLRSDFTELAENTDNSKRDEHLKNFIANWNLPRMIVLVDGDNELFIDFENEITVNVFIETIKKRSGLELREFLRPAGNAVASEKNETYNNQLIASLIKTKSTYNVVTKAQQIKNINNNSFIPGSEWLYYKIYCGAKSADKILAEAIKPITELLLQKNFITKFFFIRYNDPQFHIRFRMQLTEGADFGEVAKIIHEHLHTFHTTGHIWKVQTDTYNRETQRYGSNTTGIAEDIFYHDSVSVLQMLNETWGDEREQIRWLWAMRAIDELLEGFNLSLAQKLELTDVIKQSFAKEFNADKFLKEQLNVKFRNHRQAIENIMDKGKDSTSSLLPLLQMLADKAAHTKPLAGEILKFHSEGSLEVSLTELLSSYIHMLINRVITSKARLHEMVIYDFLYRHYRALSGRNNMQLKKALLGEE
ncbi:MAG TPA: lantibiotic dehydratase [Panacibacter sp.]|nr:lantibiotic dehydratase [Panacibacter sp.]